jgi:hypothetical protein
LPATSQQTIPADSSGSRGVISRTSGMPAMPSFSAVASSVIRAAIRGRPMAAWNANASASAQRFSKEW